MPQTVPISPIIGAMVPIKREVAELVLHRHRLFLADLLHALRPLRCSRGSVCSDRPPSTRATNESSDRAVS